MKEYTINLSKEAFDDLKSIYNYIEVEQNRPQAAYSVCGLIMNSIRSLNTMPFRYPLVKWEPFNTLGMRYFVVKYFYIFYLVVDEKNEVSISRIVSSKRDLPSQF